MTNEKSMTEQSIETQLPLSTAEPIVFRHTKIRGWLLLLCLYLTIFAPLVHIVQSIMHFSEAHQFFTKLPSLMLLMYIEAALCSLLMIFSIYAGCGLWKIRPGAVDIAKKYLLTLAAYNTFSNLLFYLGLPENITAGTLPQAGTELALSLIYIGVWYLYLLKSKRVQNTFGI